MRPPTDDEIINGVEGGQVPTGVVHTRPSILDFLFEKLDDLACWWLDWRQDQNVAQMKRDVPEMAETALLRKLEIGSEGWNIAMMHPGVYLMADEFAGFLEANKAKNYVQFDMMPRLDRGKRPIRVTVQWAQGEMPAVKASRLEREMEGLRAKTFDQAKEIYRSIHSGGCRILSEGDACKCFLCQCDAALDHG